MLERRDGTLDTIVHRPSLGDKGSSGLDQLWPTATMLPLLLLATTSSTSASLPVVCWHGVNDNANSCNAPIREAREEIPDLYAVKVGPAGATGLQVMIGEDLAMDEANSVLMRANDQVTGEVVPSTRWPVCARPSPRTLGWPRATMASASPRWLGLGLGLGWGWGWGWVALV